MLVDAQGCWNDYEMDGYAMMIVIAAVIALYACKTDLRRWLD